MAKPGDNTLEMERQLGIGRGATPFWLRWWFLVGLALLCAVAAYVYLTPKPKTQYLLQKITRITLEQTVSATGSLEPVDKVTIGAEVSGRIDTVLVDFNDRVKRGQVLARINTDDLRSRMLQARANLSAAKATLSQNEAAAGDAKRIYQRALSLQGSGFASNATVDTARTNMERADASVRQSKAQVEQSEAALILAETNLAKADIKSPIDGVVLDRKVEPGQTVQASFQSPELFVIASDLKTLELQVYIDEADIALVGPAQNASFTVDAYPAQTFRARVVTVRTAPRILNNVVAYLALLTVDNAQGLLRPGLTANAEITVRRAANVLTIPNGALRFDPQAKKGPTNPFADAETAPKEERPAADGVVRGRTYVKNANGDPEPRDVTLGISDGRRTEMKSGPFKEGDQVIVDIAVPGAANGR